MRKQPKQERSRQLVAALVESTAKAITIKGFAGLSTNYVSELAGVSQGSLYQYFDSKEDLLEALMEQIADEVTDQFRVVLDEFGHMEPRDWILQVIRFATTTLHSRDGLYMELVSNWQLLPTRELADSLQRQMLEVAQYFLMRNAVNHSIPDMPERLFICFNSVLFTLMRIYSQQKPMVREEAVILRLTDVVYSLLEDVFVTPETGGKPARS